MPTTHCLIASLPIAICEQLNRRLLNGETAESLLAWLNSVPGVWSKASDQSPSASVFRESIAQWVRGGFVDWLRLQDSLAICRTAFEARFLADLGPVRYAKYCAALGREPRSDPRFGAAKRTGVVL